MPEFFLGFLLVLTTIWTSAASARQDLLEPTQAAPTPAPAQTVEVLAIASADIADETINTNALIRAARAELSGRRDIERVKQEFEDYRAVFTTLRAQARYQLARNVAAPLIEASRREWLHVQVKLDRWVGSLAAVVRVIDAYLERIGEVEAQWRMARDLRTDDLPPELVVAVIETLDAIDLAQSDLRSQRNELLGLQARIGQAKAETVQILEDQKREIADRRRGALSVDSPPFWLMWQEPAISTSEPLGGDWDWKFGIRQVNEFLGQIAPRLALQGFFFALLVLLLFAFRRKLRHSAVTESLKSGALSPFEHPLAVALVICLTAIIIVFPGAPPLWNSLVLLLLVGATLRLMRYIVHPSVFLWAYPLGAAIAAWPILNSLNVQIQSYRSGMMLLAVLGLVCTYMISRSPRVERKNEYPSFNLFNKVNSAATVLLGFAVVANLAGSSGLTSILMAGTMLALLSAVLISLAVVMLEALVDFLIRSQFAHRLGVMREKPEAVARTLSKIVRLSGWVIWIYFALIGFLIFDPVYEATVKVLEANATVGNFSLSLADVLTFVVVVWITFGLSRFLQLILAADVLPRLRLPRGVPDAITSLTHYAVIVLGFLVALAAAGFDLSRITILVGALGVGIGFGLQNIVNNFVSGLILLFERPIRQGDVVEIDGKMAVVKSIAMRASIIRDFDGANIIVPNSDLISAKVVNWTYRSELRRIQIAVGVKYGTSPKAVIELLGKVARERPDISGSPAPEALFMAFGESSLDFMLRAWTPVDTYIQVASDLRVSIAEAFESANIEIPFPQRDIHLITQANPPEPETDAGGQSGHLPSE